VATLVIPDPSLVLLVGAAGSGKSTLARRLFAPDEILSSDALRLAVSGDESDQRASRVAFRILHDRLAARMASGRLTVVDATNAERVHRRPLIARAASAGIPVVAIVLALPDAVVHARNAGRPRVVGADVVDRHLAAVRATLSGDRLQAEGCATVAIVRTAADAAVLSIERTARPPARDEDAEWDERP
jgi:predicted kinase